MSPGRPAQVEPGPRPAWLRHLAVALVCCCVSPVHGAAEPDDLGEFLGRIGKPIAPAALSEGKPDDLPFSPEIVGAVCHAQEGIRICQVPESGEAVSFTLVNSGSPHVVPPGQEVSRGYRMRFGGRILRDAKMMISDKSRPTGRVSHILMRTSFYFFPRKAAPDLSLVPHGPDGSVLELRLPTGERVCFDRGTKEIVGGVLREDAPMDTNPDRFKRRFARISYSGRGVMIRIDQRGDSPEKAVVWGVRKAASVIFGGRTCALSPDLLWEQESGWFAFRFQTDDSLYDFLSKKCGWPRAELPADIPDDGSRCGGPAPAGAQGRSP